MSTAPTATTTTTTTTTTTNMAASPAATASTPAAQDAGTSTTATTATTAASLTTARLSAQVKKLSEANGKYKNLLKMAKERIQRQEEELETLRQEKSALEGRLEAEEREAAKRIVLEDTNDRGSDNADSDGPGGGGGGGGGASSSTVNIVRVCRVVRVPLDGVGGNRSDDGDDPNGTECREDIWSLVELESVPNYDVFASPDGGTSSSRRYKQWKRFDTESDLQDFIRRDTGEPLHLPPYSLSPEQSSRIQQESAEKVSAITEEFRRFRVRSELARKQAESQIRDLQTSNVQSAARQIERQQDHRGQAGQQQQQQQNQQQQNQQQQSASARNQIDRLKAELAAQEAQWKEAYDMLLNENHALKSEGSEALLAAQWRQRYEKVLQEKDDIQARLEMKREKAEQNGEGKYEMKYRELKESFRLYRKKAKEILESQQGVGGGSRSSSFGDGNPEGGGGVGNMLGISDNSSADAKLSYLRNLMANYLSSDQTVRDHMEGAIATVLQFTEDERERIEKKKAENEAWF